jgi:hypothetical protein
MWRAEILDLLQLSRVLERLSGQHRLSKVGFSVVPIEKKEGSKFEVLQITLEIEGTQDSSIYNFIAALENNLYGLLSPLQLKLFRTRENRIQPKIQGQYVFSWIGPGDGLKDTVQELPS